MSLSILSRAWDLVAEQEVTEVTVQDTKYCHQVTIQHF